MGRVFFSSILIIFLTSSFLVPGPNISDYHEEIANVGFPTYDPENNRIIFLRPSSPPERTDIGLLINEGYLFSVSLDDGDVRQLFPQKIGSNGEHIYGITWSHTMNMAVIKMSRSSYLLNLSTQQIRAFSPEFEFIGWWDEKIVFWEKTSEFGKKLKVLYPESWAEFEVAYFPPKFVFSITITFLIDDKLLIETSEAINPISPEEKTIKWFSVDLQSGSQEELESLPKLISDAWSPIAGATLPGPNNNSCLLQGETIDGVWTLWLLNSIQFPRLIPLQEKLSDVLWLEKSAFIFSGYRGKGDDRIRIGYCDFQNPRNVQYLPPEIAGSIKELEYFRYINLVHYDKGKSELWFYSREDLKLIKVPFFITYEGRASPWWLLALTSIIGAFLIAATFLWATKWGKRRKPRQRKPYF
ncbi:MAG: hypothetical protein ACPLPW_08300 [bacterium]